VPGTPSGPANPQLPPTGNQEYTVYTLRKYWRLNPEANIAFPGLMPEEKEEDMAPIFTGPDDGCFISFEDDNLTRVTLYPVDENTGATSPPVVYEYPHILNGSYQETWFYIFDRSVLIPGYA
jgi:hypothetical protein